MYCPQCGKPVADGARFCGNCGATISAAGASAPGMEPAAAGGPPIRPDAAPRLDAGPAPGAVPPSGINLAGVIERAKRILLSPRTEWPVIAAEPRSARDIYVGYVAPLALIGVIATFLGSIIIGVQVPLLGTIRTPFLPALIGAILHFALTFVGVFVVAWIVDALAPTFGGQKDSLRALKVTAYSFTASWVAAVVTIVPMLGFIALLAGFYGLYLLYLGLPVLMRNPADKSVGYTIVVVICTIVLFFILGVVTAGLTHMPGMGAPGVLGSAVAPRQDQGADMAAAVVSKMMGAQSGADQARMKDALSTLQKMGEQAEKSSKAGAAGGGANPVDMSVALDAVGTMMAGGKDVHPVDFHALKDMLPPSLPGLARTEATGQSGEAMGMKGSSAKADYSDGNGAGMTIEIADLGSLSGLASLATRFDPKMEKETSTGYERTRNVNGQLIHEQYDRQAKRGETSVLIGNRFSVAVRGHGVDAAQLGAALQAVDTARLPKLASK